MVRGSAGVVLVSHVTTVARQAHRDIPAWERDVRTLLLTKAILGLPYWIRAGYKGVGDVRPALLDSGVRRSCKAGHSCVRRVID